ncbi:MAG TPA: flagellar biosynthetic protein FliR [Lacipirellula sp.]
MKAALLESFLLGQFATFVLVLARVGALMATAPIFGNRSAPMQVRALLAVAMSLMMTPLYSSQAPADVTNMLAFSKFVLSEALLGALLGLGVMILVSGVQLTGHIVSQLGGTALSEGADPVTDENLPVFSQMFYFLTLAMFVLLDGHRLLTEALLDTYLWAPPGRGVLGASYVEALKTLLTQSFLLAIRAAAPAMAALLLATLVLGLIGRTLPQINILAVGFSVNALLTAGVLVLSIGAIGWAFPQPAVDAIEMLSEAIRDAVAAVDS